MRAQKIRLKLTKEQESLAWWFSKVARNTWNALVDIDRRNNKGEFDVLLAQRRCKTYKSSYHNRDVYRLNQSDYLFLLKVVCEGALETYSWYHKPNQSFIYSFIARELVTVRRLNKGKLNFQPVEKTTPHFNVRCDVSSDKKRLSRVYLKDSGNLSIPTLGDVKLGSYREGFDLSCKKQTAQVSFDGKYWYLSYTEDTSTVVDSLPDYSDGVGIDLGISTLVTVSDGTKVPNIKTFRRVRVLEKRLKRYQRRVSRKYLINKCDKHNKTKNIIKLERQIKLIYRSIRNIRVNHIREFVSRIVKKQPAFIAIEDLNVKGMMKNKHLANDIKNCSFYAIREQLIRKARERHIVVRLVDRFYPSSKTCSACGYYKADLKLSDRLFHCDSCNFLDNRDVNASVNLANTNNYVLI